uniref:Uncharacterized protein n=1 Tax=Lactuca sativa TaxID=4236 RepID=A0A9R1URE2_LACSA|nr:hypothetical protein LSAT_V11C800449100 [Lactuca sativa]
MAFGSPPQVILGDVDLSFSKFNLEDIKINIIILSTTTPTVTTSSLTIRSILEKEKLSGPNFLNWFRQLRIVLKLEKLDYVLDEPIPEELPANAPKESKDALVKHVNDSTKAMQEGFETLNAFIGFKMAERSFVSEHVLKMKAYVEQLTCLGFPFGDKLATNSFNQFLINFTMNDWERSINELRNMIKNVEANIKMSGKNQVLMIREGQISKKKTGNNTGNSPSTNPTPKTKPTPDDDCFHYNENGHWKRNCPKYLEELKNIKANQVGTLGIYVIELHAFRTNSWVFNTGSGTNICNDLHGLRNVRELRDGNLELHVGNVNHVVVKAIGQYHLLLPNGLNVILNN